MKYFCRWPAILLATLTLLLFLVACGRSSRAPTASPSPTLAPAPATAPTPVLGPTATSTPRPAAPVTPTATALPKVVVLPGDEGPHFSPVEWWYFNGHVADDQGGSYSFHFVTFQRTTPEGVAPQVLQASFSDHYRGWHLVAGKLSLALASAPGSFNVQAEDWRMTGDGHDYLLAFQTGEYFLLLRAVSRKPAALHQGTGLVDLGAAGLTYYYSQTRLEGTGTLKVGTATRQVTATIWMDHQWGAFSPVGAPGKTAVGWDWLCLQLSDGSDVMASFVWDMATHQPVATYGTYIAPDGSTRHLTGNDLVLKSAGIWTSPSNGAVYPSGWTLGVLPLSLVMNLTPIMPNSEFTGGTYIGLPYWEGAVQATGTREGVVVGGKGFVELVGYASPRPGTSPR